MSKSIGKTSAECWAQTHGFRTSDVINMIKRHNIPGVKVGNQWYVLSSFIDSRIELYSESSKHENRHRKEEPDKKSIGRKVIDWFSPRYDELTLFIMSSTVMGLLFIDTEFRSLIFDFINVDQKPVFYITVFIFFAGFILALIQSFIEREKTEIEREIMLFFAISVHAASGFFAALYLLGNSSSAIYWLFPVWNFIYSFTLLILYKIDMINISVIVDTGSSKMHLIFSLLVVVSFILIAHFIINYHWSIIISISIGLAGTLSFTIDELDQYLKTGTIV